MIASPRPSALLFCLLTLLLAACPPARSDDDDSVADDDDATTDDDDATTDDDDATTDDDDATTDDDDATTDDDDATADDDDATGDDDDSAEVVPCENPPPLDSAEWTEIPSLVALDGLYGVAPSGPGFAWAWHLASDAEIDARYGVDVPQLSGGPAPITAQTLKDLFDETTEDLVIGLVRINADGECVVPMGVYVNNLVDCFCESLWVHRDIIGPSMLPAFSEEATVFTIPDQGVDAFPGSLIFDAITTQRDLSAP